MKFSSKPIRRVLIAATVLAGVGLLLLPVVTGGRYTPDRQGAPITAQAGQPEGNGALPGTAPIPVLTAAAQTSDVPVFIEGVGTGKARQSVLIRSQADGVLLNLFFKEGQDVKEGDLIAQIDPRLYRATLDQNIAKKASDEALLANAILDRDRYTKLVQTNAATQQQLDTARATASQYEAQVKLDQAMIDSARTSLSYTDIRTPISGRTGIRAVDIGNVIHATDTTGIVTVSQIQPIDVIFTLPQQELARINRATMGGALQALAYDDKGDKPVDRGTLDVIDNTIDATTGTVKLRATFPNAALALWPGIFVNVRLRVETLHDAVIVPAAAIQRGPKGSFVYVLRQDKAALRPVVLGQQDDQKAIIESGVAPGEVVVTTGFAKLADGSSVAPSHDEAAVAEMTTALNSKSTGPARPAQATAPSADPAQPANGAANQLR